MNNTLSDQRTSRFYQWETRCRGWHLYDAPVHLEPTFKPYIFTPPPVQQTDDGKRHTPLSWLASLVTGKTDSDNVDLAEENSEELAPFTLDEDAPLCGFSISFSKNHFGKLYEMEQLISMLSYTTYPVSFEIIGNYTEINIQIVCREPDKGHIFAQTKAFFPQSIIIEQINTLSDFVSETSYTAIVDFGLSEEFMRPTASYTSFKLDPLIGIFGALEHLKEDQQAAIQILFHGTVNPWSASILDSVTDYDGKSFFSDAPDMVDLAHEKISSPLFAVVIRVIGHGKTEEGAVSILETIGNTIMHVSQSNSNSLRPLVTEAYSFESRLQDAVLRQSHRQGMILNSKELVTLVHFPTELVTSAKLHRNTTKSKRAPAQAIGNTLILGSNIHQGNSVIASINDTQRTKHMHIIGSTGTGKSTFLLNLIRQDIENNQGITVCDPHGDLIESILQYIPEHRINDVVYIDPSDSEYPVGFNILSAHSEIEKEILSSDLVAAFRRLSTSWGDQMNSVFANAILAILESESGGTLIDLRRFLIEKPFRDTFLKTVSDPAISYYWHKEYPLLKTSSIGSILTRLDTFLRPKLIRNMVAQKQSLDFEQLLNSQKIILVKLSQGLIGTENSYLLGSLIVSKIHQAAMARQVKSNEFRTNHFLYIDEFQNFITPSMSAILSGARKYHLGLILAHQDMQQLMKYDSELASSVTANAGTRICFRLGDTDAKKFEQTLSGFDSHDLQSLSTGEAVVRLERSDQDFNIITSPLPQINQKEASLRKSLILTHSRQTYSTPVSAVIDSLKVDHISNEVTIVPKKETLVQDAGAVETGNSLPTKEKGSITPTKEVTYIPKQSQEKKEQNQHRYLQTLIKKMAESRGFKANIEEPTLDGKGRIDVALERNGLKIACEISVTSTDIYEVHNIEKCLSTGYDLVVVCSPETKILNNIRNAVFQNIPESDHSKIQTLEPDALFRLLDSMIAKEASTETRIKGYRVKVEYGAISKDEMKKKRNTISEMILKSIKRAKK